MHEFQSTFSNVVVEAEIWPIHAYKNMWRER